MHRTICKLILTAVKVKNKLYTKDNDLTKFLLPVSIHIA